MRCHVVVWNAILKEEVLNPKWFYEQIMISVLILKNAGQTTAKVAQAQTPCLSALHTI